MKQLQKSTQIKLLLFLLFLPFLGFSQSNISQYTFTFEDTTHDYFMYRDTISNPNCIWQIGAPNKTIFTTPVSASNSIITDTVYSYPINDTSSFIIKHEVGGGYLIWAVPIVQLNGRYFVNSDSLNDFGKIEFSPDNGISWVLVSDDTLNYGAGNNWPSINDYFTLTGNSNGWKHFYIDMSVYPNTTFNNGDTVQYKFTFISDSNYDNLDGLMFDNIEVRDIAGSAVKELSKSNNSSYPNPFSNQLNFILSPEATSIFIYNINGKLVYSSQFKHQSQIEINTSHFENGFYFYDLLDENGVRLENGKVVKY